MYKIRLTSSLLSGELNLLRHLSTTTSPPQKVAHESRYINKAELYRKLSGVGSSGLNVFIVLDKLSETGFNIRDIDLLFCVKNLRRHRRYDDCFQILEWMEKGQKGSINLSTYALRLDLTCKVKGIDEAERYIFNIPPHARTPYVFGALLNCYCYEKIPGKAFELFRHMDEMNWVSNSLPFCNLMSLYMKLDRPEKVPPLVQEMKRRNIPLAGITYHIWLQSYGRLKDLAGVVRVMEEVEGHDFLRHDWKIYTTLASAYIDAGQPERAASALRNLEDVLNLSNRSDRTAYHQLISLHAKTGNQYSVFQAWRQLNSKYPECHNKSYLLMLQTLSKLDNVEGLKKVLVEWESRCISYDARIPCFVIGAYLRRGMLEEAQLLFKDVTSRKTRQNLWSTHVSFMEYYLRNQQIDSAVSHMKDAYSNGWKPCSETLSPFFEKFKQEIDFHGTENPSRNVTKGELYRRLSGVGSSGQNVIMVLDKLAHTGFNISHRDLQLCVKKLRKYGCYNDCFQILEWMEKDQKGSIDIAMCALRLELTCKTKGIDEAERYFLSLPPHPKMRFVYGAMLNCYCNTKMPVKAFKLFREMDEMKWISGGFVFNNLMRLCLKVGQPEKVPSLVQEMKQRNIPLSDISYHTWLLSYSRLNDLAGVERVMEEVEGHDFLRHDWKIYRCLATAYIDAGQPQRAAFALKNLEGVLNHLKFPDRNAYHHLISLHAKTANQDSVFQAWRQLNSKFRECHNKSYLLMLRTLSNLDNVEDLKKVYVEWESRYEGYDVRIPCVVIDAYLRHGMFEEAQLLFRDTTSRNDGQTLWLPHVSFMEYYLRTQQVDSAISHIEDAYSNGWKPCSEKLSPFFEYFKQGKDFCGAEKLCKMLKDVQAMDSSAYLWLLQTYVAAGEHLSEMRQRMEIDSIDINPEHEELLTKICQN